MMDFDKPVQKLSHKKKKHERMRRYLNISYPALLFLHFAMSPGALSSEFITRKIPDLKSPPLHKCSKKMKRKWKTQNQPTKND